MAQAVAYSKTGAKKDAKVKLSAGIFDVEPNHQLIGQAYTMYMSNGRAGGAQTLTRGMVRGGGKKPWKQKGTGRARAGSSRLPHWTGGGVAFGPTGNENFTKVLPLKAKRAALRQALSLQAASGIISVIESFDGGEGKTRGVAELLTKLNVQGRVVVVVADKTPAIDRSTRNIPQLDVVAAQYLNVALIVNADHILMTTEAHDAVSKWLEVKA